MDSGIPTLMTLIVVGCGFSFICPPSSPLDQGPRVRGLWGQGCDSFFLESRCLIERLFADGCVDSQDSCAGGGGVFPSTDATLQLASLACLLNSPFWGFLHILNGLHPASPPVGRWGENEANGFKRPNYCSLSNSLQAIQSC